MSARRVAAYGLLAVAAVPVTAALAVAVDRARMWRNATRGRRAG